jgi:molecular chaperone DnaK
MNRSTIDFGIDLGTTNSAIAVIRGVETDIIKNNLDQDITPSAVSYDKKGTLYVGDRAKKRVSSKPNDAFVEFKRRMGTEFIYSFEESGIKRKPEELSAEVLKSLRADVSRTTGEEISGAVITVPAAFKLPQCDATRKAGELAGLISCPLLQEPVAAALAYGFQVDSEKAYWLAYDFGGGTFDAALIKAEEGLINVVHHGGDNFLGGSDIDWAIIDKLIIPKLAGAFNLPDFKRSNEVKWGSAIRKLKWFIEAAKIDLSTKTSTSLLDCTFEDADGSEVDCSEITITQAELIGIAEPIIKRSIEICQKVLKEKNLPSSAVARVILVGGPTKAPYFREILADGLGIAIDHSVDPLTVVARGAAVFASAQRIDARLRPVAKVGEFKVDLKYKPVGHDNEPLIGGKVASLDGSTVEGFVLEFVNAKTQWRSGKISLRADGSFVANLLADKGERNVFMLELFDASGAQQKAVPDHLTYTVGGEVGEQPLINSVGITLANNDVEWFFEKGAGLPLKKKCPHLFRTTKELVVGAAGAAVNILTIPVVEGENDIGDRNHLVGLLNISSDSIKRDLPQGSDIELTLKIDESRIITVNAYVPILDEEFEIALDPRKKTTVVPVLIQEHEQEIKRLGTLLDQAKKVNDQEATASLEKVKASPLIQELRDAMAAAKGDPDAASKGESRLLELKLGLDEIENKMKWPTLVTDARNWLDDLDKVVKGTGSQELQAQAIQLQKDIDKIIANKEVDRLARKITNVKDLFYKALGSLPKTWVDEFGRLQRMQAKFLDQAKAQRFLEMGQNYLAQNNIDGLRNVVYGLWDLLPKQVAEEARLGFGATITR